MNNSISFKGSINPVIEYGIAKATTQELVEVLEAQIASEKAKWEVIMSPTTCMDDPDYGRMIYQHEHPDFWSETFLPENHGIVCGLELAIQLLKDQMYLE